MSDTDREAIPCIFSHRCGEESHALGRRVAAELLKSGLRVAIDELFVGDSVHAWMTSTEFEALIFAATPDSWSSPYCRIELETAEARSAPIFVLRVRGAIPPEFQDRLWLEPEALVEPVFQEKMEGLARAIRERVAFVSQIRLLGGEPAPVEAISGIRDLAVVTRPAILAENLLLLADRFRASANDQYRYWIARAIGRAGSPQALQLLRVLEHDDAGPFGKEGLAEAIDEFATELRRPLNEEKH